MTISSLLHHAKRSAPVARRILTKSSLRPHAAAAGTLRLDEWNRLHKTSLQAAYFSSSPPPYPTYTTADLSAVLANWFSKIPKGFENFFPKDGKVTRKESETKKSPEVQKASFPVEFQRQEFQRIS